MKYPPVHYNDYLKISSLLGSQSLRSEEFGKPAHDEMLFIIVHQTYELWFKQMLFEIDSVLKALSNATVDENLMGTIVARLERVVSIQRFINGQIDILETMTPLDFLEFRDFLYPASGFQSFQWRAIETKLGLQSDFRLNYNNEPFFKSLSENQQSEMKKILSEPSLFDLLEKWLERTPFLQTEKFDFWENYKKAVEQLLKEDEEVVLKNARLSQPEKERNVQQIHQTLKMFNSLFNESEYKKLQENGFFRLSYKAIHASLLIQLYRDQPILQMPFRLIRALVDLDENMTQWRYRHSLMAHRMLGRKIGTGGSSGHDYLRAATDKHKIFTDFFNLTTFFIPRSQVPPLPTEVLKHMTFR